MVYMTLGGHGLIRYIVIDGHEIIKCVQLQRHSVPIQHQVTSLSLESRYRNFVLHCHGHQGHSGA